MNKIKYIFKESLAQKLCNSNHAIVYIRKNHKDKNKYVFLFEETEKFIKDFTALSSK